MGQANLCVVNGAENCSSHTKPTETRWKLRVVTRFADTGVPLPLVRTAAVGGARWWDAGVAHITACFHFDSSGGAGQGGGIRPHTQPNALLTKAEVGINKQQTLKGDWLHNNTSHTLILLPTCTHPRIPFWTSPEPSTPPTCRCFTFRPCISFPTMTVP